MPLRRIASVAITVGLDKYDQHLQKKLEKQRARVEMPLFLNDKKLARHVMIQVDNFEKGITWQREIPKDQAELVEAKMSSAKVVGIFPALLKPVRSDCAKNFSKDFFLPTTLNQAVKVRSVAIRVFAVLVSLVLDLATFPIRLLTCIPTVIRNSSPQRHPFYAFLRMQEVDSKLLESGHVLVTIITKDKIRQLNVNFFVQPVYPACYSFNATQWK